jgi:hypothetical protein
VYCTFLALDIEAFRRTENIQILTVFNKRADLASVLNIISKEMSVLGREGLPVLDLKNARPRDALDLKSPVPGAGEYIETSSGIQPPLRVPFKRIFPRIACSTGDAVNQAVLGSGRAVWSTFLCRMCFGNIASKGYHSTIYLLRHQILEYHQCKYTNTFN